MLRSAWFSASTWTRGALRKSSSLRSWNAGVARHREIGAVELQHEAGGDDRFVFGRIAVGDRFEIGFVRRVVVVRLEQREMRPGDAAFMKPRPASAAASARA